MRPSLSVRVVWCLSWLVVASMHAQKTPAPLNLVMPSGKGRIIVPPSGNGIRWERLNLYDDGNRPVFLVSDESHKLDISFVLFPNLTKSTSPEICRDTC